MAGGIETRKLQDTIIKLQSDVIKELYILLMEHITAEEADSLPTKKKIDLAAEFKADLTKHRKEHET